MTTLFIFTIPISDDGGNKMKVKTAVCTSVGRKREVNQDNFCVNGFINSDAKTYILKSYFSSSKEQLLSVCDGMGGEKHGEIASLLASRQLAEYQEENPCLAEDFENHVRKFAFHANAAVCKYMESHGDEHMGSTLASLCISPGHGKAMAANVGDSKVYLFRDGNLEKLTVDHNVAQRLVDMGIITQEEARTHKEKSKLTQHIGISPDELEIEPHISRAVELKKGDLFLICSDGLTDMLDEKAICDILASDGSVKEKCHTLVSTADQNGGTDNTTVVLALVK